MVDIYDDYCHLARLALEGRQPDVAALVRKSLRKIATVRPDLVDAVRNALGNYETRAPGIRGTNIRQALPIDIDSKLELLRREIVVFDEDPVWPAVVSNELNAVVEERKCTSELMQLGLFPTRSLLFVGPPGVGKTLAARWLAHRLGRQLLTLDLAAVMSSYLGRTGTNIRAVLDYAKRTPSVLLLDEFDAIAKRRNDDSEVGELKRLVTVLLQTVDDWPDDGLLIAATNHPDLLDPAVWRRFERIVKFPYPNKEEIHRTMTALLVVTSEQEERLLDTLSIVLQGASFAEVTRLMNLTKRDSVVRKIPQAKALEDLIHNQCAGLNREQKRAIALELLACGLSQRRISEMTGISRDTLRKYKGVNRTRANGGYTEDYGARE